MTGLRVAVVALVGASLIGTGVAAAASQPLDSAYIDAPVAEAPSAVAVADTGLVAAALFDARAVALVDVDGRVRNIEIGCSPHDVELNPDGTTAWAVCQSDQHLYVIDVPSGISQVASMGSTGLDDVTYLPAVDRLLIASIEDNGGQILTVDARPGSYEVIDRVVSNEWRFTQLAPYFDGARTYALTDAGMLLYVDIAMGGQIAVVPAASPGRSFASIALNPTNTALYAVSIDSSDPGNVRTSIDHVRPGGGAPVQSFPLDLTLPSATKIDIAGNARSIFVSSGISVRVGDSTSGLVRLPLDRHGRLGAPVSLDVTGAFGSAVATSSNGSRVTFGTTNSTVIGTDVDGTAYPKAIEVTAQAKGKRLTVAGTTVSLRPMTQLTVHVRDLTRTKSTFVKQSTPAYVDSSGKVVWTGKAPSKRFDLYVSGAGAKSKTVKVSVRP